MENNGYSYFLLSVMANMAQLIDFQMNITQVSNSDIMKYLEKQNEMLEKIIKLLENK